MLNKLVKVKDKVLYGIPVALAIMSAENSAYAQEGIGGIADKVNSQLGSVGELVLGGSFIGGIVMAATGLVKLKAAADSQGQQTKYGEGLWRLGVGSGLVAVPAVVKVGAATTGLSTGGNPGVAGF